MYIFAGSYERFIFGYSANADCSEAQDILKRYTFAAHKSGVKCLVAAGSYVASGGSDDLIHMYDMKGERDLGTLMNPCDGAVPCLEFFTPEGRANPSHMLSGSADGGINIWRCRDWEHLKVMRGHKGGVNSIAVHHSGKLALSTARDGAIRMWNLVKGRCTYTAKLEAEAETVAFSRSGDAYRLLCGNRITVHSTMGAGALLAAYTAPRRILCSASQSDALVLLGLEDGSVRLWDVRSSAVVGGIERAHGSRVRGMAILQEGGAGQQVPLSLATASSDGTIKLWDLRKMSSSGAAGAAAAAEGATGAACTAQVSTGARLTCLAAVDPEARAPVRPKPAAAVAGAAAGAKQGQGKAKQKPTAGKAGSAATAGGRQESSEGKGNKLPKKAAPAAARQQAGQRPQPQQQKQAQKQKVQQGKGNGMQQGPAKGRRPSHADDDPGFEIVPAPRDEETAAANGPARKGMKGKKRPLDGADDGPGSKGPVERLRAKEEGRLEQQAHGRQPTAKKQKGSGGNAVSGHPGGTGAGGKGPGRPGPGKEPAAKVAGGKQGTKKAPGR